MTPQERKTPSPADAKRLFALSGNRCAFPKCPATIVQDGALVGEICHIRAANLGGQRYDSTQTAAERHGFENLILLCANHHTVVDSDPDAYTVERLFRMKSDQEEHAATITDSSLLNRFQVLIDQSVHNDSYGSGFAAHTINAGAINLHPPAQSTIAEGRTTQAVEALWGMILLLKEKFGELAVVDVILTRDELQSCFAGTDSNSFFERLAPYSAFDTIARMHEATGASGAEKERPFVSTRLYALFLAIQAVWGRVAVLTHFSFEEMHYQSWRNDAGIEQHLKAVLPEKTIASLRGSTSFGLRSVIEVLENEFLAESERCRRGVKT